MTSAAPTARPAIWLVSARADVLAILVAGPVISLLLLAAAAHGPSFLIGALLFAVFLDLPHVLHTHVRLLANPADYRRNRGQFWGSLAFITTLCVGLAAAGQFLWLVALWVYWQPYHVCKQHFGVATLYARRSGYRRDTQHVLYLMLAGFTAPLLHRMSQGGFRFGDYELFGEKLPFANMLVPTPPVPATLALFAYGLFALAACHFIWREWRDTRTDGAGLPHFVWWMLLVSLALYNAAYLFVSDLYALILIGTSIHAIQYHLVCVSTVKTAVSQARTPPDSSAIVRYLHAAVARISGTRWLAFALVGAGLVVLATEIPTLGIIPLIVVLHHFYLDGVIWKRRPGA